jgi:hypothetical protein
VTEPLRSSTEPLLSYESVREALDLAEKVALAGLDVFFTSTPDSATAAAFNATLDGITKTAATTAASVITALALVLDYLADQSESARQLLMQTFALHRIAFDRIIDAATDCDDIGTVRRTFLGN